MATWEEIAAEGQIGDLVVPISRRQMSGGRSAARIKLPYQPGQDFEDTGREPFAFKVEIPLYADVDESHYPQLYTDLVALLTDERVKGEVEYIDPILGPFEVKVIDLSEEHVSDVRHGATITIGLEERSLDVRTFTVTRLTSASADATDAAADLDDALEEQGVSDDAVSAALTDAGLPLTDEERTSASTRNVGATEGIARDFVDEMREGALLADEIVSRVDVVRARVSALMALGQLRSADGIAGYLAGLRLIDAVSRLAEETLARAVPIVEIAVTGATDIYTLAAKLYGDIGRADDILARNPGASPLSLRVGTTLRVAER